MNLKKIKLSTNLLSLDLDFLNLKSMSFLDDAQYLTLTELRIQNNAISKIEGLEKMINLRSLDLADNNITQISGVNHLTNLEYLELNNNAIEKIENINNLDNLRKLNLTGNNIYTLENIEELDSLEALAIDKKVKYITRESYEYIINKDISVEVFYDDKEFVPYFGSDIERLDLTII